MERIKNLKSIHAVIIIAFIITFVGLFWTLQQDTNFLRYQSLSTNNTMLSHKKEIISIPQYNPQSLNDSYFEIFYRNKHITNHIKSDQEIDDVYNMWWNYNNFPMRSFTECEEKYLGYKQNNKQNIPGDLSFNNSNYLKTLCINNDENDLRHSNIECYNTRFKGSSYVCSFKNIYGFIDDQNDLKFVAFCNNIQNLNILSKIKKSYKSSLNNGFPLYIDIKNDSSNLKIIDDAKYYDLNNIWFYDNDNQCESHKKGDSEHIGNPWHCFAHIEYWYRIAKAKNISEDHTTLVMSQYSDYKFGSNIALYHLYSPLFGNIINADSIKRAVREHDEMNKNTLYYIKQLYIDERSANGWGAATIWQQKPRKNFLVDEVCRRSKHLRRSHIYYDLKKDLMNYYELTDEYAKYDWIKEIKSIQNVNKWDIIKGDLESVRNGTNKLLIVATRYINGRCRYRCIGNMKDIANRISQSLYPNYVVIHGNPGSLTFHAQYHLFKNCKIFIGVHGAVFLMASLFMDPQNLKFELTMKLSNKEGTEPNSEMVVRMFGNTKVAYGKFFCGFCESKNGKKPSNVNENDVVDAFKDTFYNIYNMTL